MGAGITTSQINNTSTATVVNSSTVTTQNTCSSNLTSNSKIIISGINAVGDVIINGVGNNTSIISDFKCKQLNTATIHNFDIMKTSLDSSISQMKSGMDLQIASVQTSNMSNSIASLVTNSSTITNINNCMGGTNTDSSILIDDIQSGKNVYISDIKNNVGIITFQDCLTKNDTENQSISKIDDTIKATSDQINKGFDLNQAISAYTSMFIAIALFVVIGLVIAVIVFSSMAKKLIPGIISAKIPDIISASSSASSSFGKFRFGDLNEKNDIKEKNKNIALIVISILFFLGLAIGAYFVVISIVNSVTYDKKDKIKTIQISSVIPINKNEWKYGTERYDNITNNLIQEKFEEIKKNGKGTGEYTLISPSTNVTLKTFCYYCPDGRHNCAKTDLYTLFLNSTNDGTYVCLPNNQIPDLNTQYLNTDADTVDFTDWSLSDYTRAKDVNALYTGQLFVTDSQLTNVTSKFAIFDDKTSYKNNKKIMIVSSSS